MGSRNASSSGAFKLPDCWKDDVRMATLFALPSNESLNSKDWAGTYKFWKELILEWATQNQKLLFHVEDLRKTFARDGKYPVSLNRVLDEMKNNGDVFMKEQYSHQTDQPSSWTSWAASLIMSFVTGEMEMTYFTEHVEAIPEYIVSSVLKKKTFDISEVDRSLASLKQREKLLNDEIDRIETKMKSLEQTARKRLQKGSREAAKAALNRRKKLEAVVDLRKQTLSSIQTWQTTILHLAKAESVSKDTLSEVETVLKQHHDIMNIMSQSLEQEENESELEEELENIMAEGDANPSLEEELILPSVSTDSPAPSPARESTRAHNVRPVVAP